MYSSGCVVQVDSVFRGKTFVPIRVTIIHLRVNQYIYDCVCSCPDQREMILGQDKNNDKIKVFKC